MPSDHPADVLAAVRLLDLRASEPLWIVGPVTWDLFGGARTAGGAVSYTARAAAALGIRAHILACGGVDAPFDAFHGHKLHRVGAQTLTFTHTFPGGRRVLVAERRTGRTITPDDAPAGWPTPSTLILAPLMPEDVDVVGFLDRWPEARAALPAQGLQRYVEGDDGGLHEGPDATVRERDAPSAALMDAARPNVTVFLSAEETVRWPVESLALLASRAEALVLTRGAQGAEIWRGGAVQMVASMPAQATDTTGAGDVFATAFILARRAGDDVAAGWLAAACAAASVEVNGPGPLPSRSELEARIAALRPQAQGGGPEQGPAA